MYSNIYSNMYSKIHSIKYSNIYLNIYSNVSVIKYSTLKVRCSPDKIMRDICGEEANTDFNCCKETMNSS